MYYPKVPNKSTGSNNTAKKIFVKSNLCTLYSRKGHMLLPVTSFTEGGLKYWCTCGELCQSINEPCTIICNPRVNTVD